MKRTFVLFLAAILLISTAMVHVSTLAPNSEPSIGDVKGSPVPISQSLPDGYFTKNHGQIRNENVRFYLSSGNTRVGFAAAAVLLMVVEHTDQKPDISSSFDLAEYLAPEDRVTTRGVLVRISFANSHVVNPKGRGELSFTNNYFLGNDPSKWLTGVHNYREIVYENLYDGIDLVYGMKDGHLKYEFHVSPGADPGQIEIEYEGIDGLLLDIDGGITASTSIGSMRDLAPVSYQESEEIKCPFSLRGPFSFGFACEGRDDSRALVIDPLVYSTFLGGTDGETPQDIATDFAGNVYVVGYTESNDFPVTPGAFDVSFNGGQDGFLAKLNPNGDSLAWATFFGSSNSDVARGIAIDPLGDVYVVGNTASADFPVTMGAFDTSHNGHADVFVARFTGGGVLTWSTYMGGTDDDRGMSIVLDGSGNVVIAGYTQSPDFPVTPGAFDVSQNGAADGFVAKLDPSGATLLWATFLGGSTMDLLGMVTVGPDDSVYATGATESSDFPVTPGAFDVMLEGMADAFIAKLNSTGSDLIWATYLGGTGYDNCRTIILDNSGDVYVAGGTDSLDFPVTPGAFDTTYNGLFDAFIAKLNSTGNNILWATYLGGGDNDPEVTIALNVAGDVIVAGMTWSADFPVTPGAFDTTLGGIFDGYLARLNPNGTRLLYATFIGGGGEDTTPDIVLDSSGYVYLAGRTTSSDFPVTPGAFDTTYNGGYDATISKFGSVGPPNTPPGLDWTGETNHVSDGLDPETGMTYTDFTYRVAYYDADNNPPSQVKVKIEKPLGNPWVTSLMSFDGWMGAPDNYTTGAIYTFATRLSAGIDYWYYFQASDGWEWATGPPTVPVDAPDVISDNPPTAVAQASPTSAFMNDTINFDATNSTDDFGITAYLWDFGDTTTDTNPLTTHIYTSRGTFLATLTVWDTVNQNDNDTVSISIENRPPISNAGPDQNVNKNQMVTLNGTGSVDPDGDVLTYVWNQTNGPPVVLTGADTATPTFSSSVSGMYTFTLTVEDGWGGSSNDTVNVTVVNRDPTADAGPDQIVPKKTVVTLDGTGSSDPDNDLLNYAWTQTNGPAVVLTGADTYSPTFTPPTSGIYVFQLVVNDNDNGTSSDTVQVTATNTQPVADAGSDRTVRKKTLVTLDGSSSFDLDGDVLTYSWTQTSGPSVTVTGANTATPSFTPPRSGNYTFQLTVDDNDGGIATDSVTVTATNTLPVADAGQNMTVKKNTLVALYGSLSFDSDNDLLMFSWTQLSGPSVTLTNADTSTPTFTPSKAGTYVFRLNVNDGDGGTSEDMVTVTVWGLPPTANLVARPPSTHVGMRIEFDGSDSTDPDGTIVDFEFSFGDSASANGTEAVREHSYNSAGTYTVTLTVTDDDGNTSTAQVTVEVTETPPPTVGTNYKPLIALIFAIVLAVTGLWSSRRRPWKDGENRKAVAKAFTFICLPFILVEIMTGILSVFIDPLKIPPVIGWGTGVDVLILVVGLLFSLLRLARKDGGMKPEETNA
jgi:hypothetical protein